MKALTIFPENSKEYKNFETICDIVNAQRNDIKLTIENVFFDISQNWVYTTLICNKLPMPTNSSDSLFNSYQILNPVEQEIAVYGTDEERTELINKLLRKK